jgi:hypothetical protein
MELKQEYTELNHSDYLDSKMNSDFDIIIFFDIDCIPLKPNLYEYLVDQVSDDNSIIGIEQAPNHINHNNIYAGPACFAISKKTFENLGKPSFKLSDKVDTGGEFTISAKKNDVNVKLLNIVSSLNKKWKCGKKKFGNGTNYDDWIYHQFEVRVYDNRPENQFGQYQFVNKCKEIMRKNGTFL